MAFLNLQYDEEENVYRVQSDILNQIRDMFSAKIPKFGSQKFNPFAPDRKFLITPDGKFPFGLYEEIVKLAMLLNPSIVPTMDEELSNRIKKASMRKMIDNIFPLNLTMRDYQEEAFLAVAKKGFGNFEMATSSGKTLLMAYIAFNFLKHYGMKKKVLILVPDLGLAEKTKLDLTEYGLEQYISTWTGNRKSKLDISKQIIIANNAVILARISANSWIYNVDLLLYDESHTCNIENGIYKKVVSQIKTLRKVGFTGTIPNVDYEKWGLIGTFGKIIYRKKAHELKKYGHIANADILILEVDYKDIPDYDIKADDLENYNIELNHVISNKYRNKLISNLCSKMEGNILILVDRIEHGEVIQKKLEQLENKEIIFVRGSTSIDERQRLIQKMEESTNICCIAMSKIFSTGINIKNLPNIVFAWIGKSKKKVIQSIGRGLRLHENKESLTVVDICDQFRFSRKHCVERILLYIEEKIPYHIKKINEK